MLYFNNNDSGIQDCGNLVNYSQDSGNTVPAIALPASGDDVTLNCDILISSMGSLTCHNLYLNGFSVGPDSGFATAVTIAGAASIVGSGSGANNWNTTEPYGGSLLVAVTVNFIYDTVADISGSSGCNYNFVTVTANISDDGTGVFSGGSYSNSLIYAGTLDNTSVPNATNFGSISVTGSITSTNLAFNAGGWTITAAVSITSGTYGYTVTTPAFSATIDGGTLKTTTFTGTQTGGAITLTGTTATFNPASRSGGTVTTDGTVVTIAYADPITGDSFTTAAPSYTPAQYVLSGQTTGGNPGSLTLPSTTAVLAPAAGGPASWGVGGTGSTGTYTPSGGLRQNGYDGGFNG